MFDYKQDVIDWLNLNNHDRYWLADQCQVAKRTVDNWLVSPRPIPAKSRLIIDKLMEIDKQKEIINEKTLQNLVLEFTKAEFDAICDKAVAEGTRPSTWAQNELNRLANEDISTLAARIKAEQKTKVDYRKLDPPATPRLNDNVIDPAQEAENERNDNGGEANTHPA